MDELDKLMHSRAKSRGGGEWGEMSSVNSDITKEIQELLKKKDNGMGSNGRPSSISNAGRQTLMTKQPYAYEGMTLSNFDIILQILMLAVSELLEPMAQQIQTKSMGEMMPDSVS